MRPLTPETAQSKLAAACARAEICPADALARLRRRGLSMSDAEAIVDRLIDGGFIDAGRYARAFAADKMRFAGWGRRKIAMALRAKRIEREYITSALEALDPDEYESRLEAVLRAKARTLKSGSLEPYERRRKLFAFALGRGFESDLIGPAISGISDNDDDYGGEDGEVWP